MNIQSNWSRRILTAALAGATALTLSGADLSERRSDQRPDVDRVGETSEAEAAGSHGVGRIDFAEAPADAEGRWRPGCRRLPGVTLDACLESAGGGELRGSDQGVAFPERGGGKAILRLSDEDAWKPQRADFSVSARFRLDPADARTGANLVQKGGYRGHQWKLQVDYGVPTCRVSGRRDGVHGSAMARAPRPVTANAWNTAECRRSGDRLELWVNGKLVATDSGAGVRIAPTLPAVIGGKHVGVDNDQFRGELAEVEYRLR